MRVDSTTNLRLLQQVCTRAHRPQRPPHPDLPFPPPPTSLTQIAPSTRRQGASDRQPCSDCNSCALKCSSGPQRGDSSTHRRPSAQLPRDPPRCLPQTARGLMLGTDGVARWCADSDAARDRVSCARLKVSGGAPRSPSSASSVSTFPRSGRSPFDSISPPQPGCSCCAPSRHTGAQRAAASCTHPSSPLTLVARLLHPRPSASLSSTLTARGCAVLCRASRHALPSRCDVPLSQPDLTPPFVYFLSFLACRLRRTRIDASFGRHRC